jgi:L-serine dehydratase
VVSLLDIIGPVMVGPSSSHTAGACRLGLLARNLVGGTPERARIELPRILCANRLRATARTRPIAGGLMGFARTTSGSVTRSRSPSARGLDYGSRKPRSARAHPNTTRITLERGEPQSRDDGRVARRGPHPRH